MNESKQYDIPKRAVIEAYKRVKANKGSAGIDGIDIEKYEEKLQTCTIGRSKVVSHMIALILQTLLEVVVQRCIVHFGDILQGHGCCLVVGYMVYHSLECYDVGNKLLQDLGLPYSQHDSCHEQRQCAVRQTTVDLCEVQLILIGLVTEFDDAEADRIDHNAQHQHDKCYEPP